MAWWIVVVVLIISNYFLLPVQLIALCTFIGGVFLSGHYQSGGAITKAAIIVLNVILLAIASITVGILIIKLLTWANGAGQPGGVAVGLIGMALAIFPIWQVRRLLVLNRRYEPDIFLPKQAVYHARLPALLIVAAVLFWLNMNEDVLQIVFLPLLGIALVVLLVNVLLMFLSTSRGANIAS